VTSLFFGFKVFDFVIMIYSSENLIFSSRSVHWEEFWVLDVWHTKVVFDDCPGLYGPSQGLFAVAADQRVINAL